MVQHARDMTPRFGVASVDRFGGKNAVEAVGHKFLATVDLLAIMLEAPCRVGAADARVWQRVR